MNHDITKVYLLNVPLENDYKNTLYFENKESQQAYFHSRVVKSYTDFSYQRKDSFIRVPSHFDSLQNINYVMYQNPQHSNKWYYAFVTDIKYVQDDRTDLIIEIDYLQTWLFDYNVKESFVEREHVSDDRIGIHTYPENVELGEYICENRVSDSATDEALRDCCYIFASTLTTILNESGEFDHTDGKIYNGVYSGIEYFRFNDVLGYKIWHDLYAEHDGALDAIQGFFLAPKWLAPYKPTEQGAGVIQESETASTLTFSIPKNISSLNGYTPRNKKLFTYPYKYMMCTNNVGGSAIYHYEKFITESNDCSFMVRGALTPGCSVRMMPTNYNGASVNVEEGLGLGKYPICSYTTDMFTNWMTQNSLNIATDIVGGSLQMGVGIAGMGTAMGAAFGSLALASGVNSIASTLAQVHQQSMTPPQANGNVNSGDVVFASGLNTFDFYQMSIKKEYAQIIDKYFDMFGYKVCMVKKPNTNHRSRYWYTKTIDVNIDGAIPNKDMQKIKDCYNNGITFWRNPEEIQDYSKSNTIV